MSARYTVTWADRAGPAGWQDFDTFQEALTLYQTLRAENVIRGTVVASICGDGAEHDGERWHDGLTEDERDQL